MKKNIKYNASFRCYYNDETGVHYNNHYFPQFPTSDIPKWLDSYLFTHPNCTSVSVKIWFKNGWDGQNENDDD